MLHTEKTERALLIVQTKKILSALLRRSRHLHATIMTN